MGQGRKKLEVSETAQMAEVAPGRVSLRKGLFPLGSLLACLLRVGAPDSQKEGWNRRLRWGGNGNIG